MTRLRHIFAFTTATAVVGVSLLTGPAAANRSREHRPETSR